jgi:Ni/Co efflux regulator RcnB
MRMRTMVLAAVAAAVAVPSVASAQSAREVRHDQREVRRDMRHGDYREAREDRRELREDWRDYRRSHREVYRRPAYAGPRGWRYRPVAVGHRFAPVYYGRNYWVNDYARYRLPRPGADRRWVRYGNDVVLVNIRTGRVISVYHSFFY